MRKQITKLAVLAVAAMLVVGLAQQAQAADVYWKADTIGNWATAENWVGGVLPASGNSARMGNGTSAITIDANVNIGGSYFWTNTGYNSAVMDGTAAPSWNSGSIYLSTPKDAAGPGFTVEGGTLNIGGGRALIMAWNNTGNARGDFVQLAGTVTIAGNLSMCIKSSTQVSHYDLEGGDFAASNIQLGSGSQKYEAVFTQSAGTATVNTQIRLGYNMASSSNPSSKAVVNLDGGELTIKGGTPFAFTQTAGVPVYVDLDGGALNLKGTWGFGDLTGITDSDFRSFGVAATAGTLSFEPTLVGTDVYTRITAFTGLPIGDPNNDAPAGWTKASVNVASGATLRTILDTTSAAGISAAELGTLMDATHLGDPAGTGGLASGARLGLDANTGDFTTSAAIPDASGGANMLHIQKLGPDKLTLAVANTYTGTTTVSEGTLAYGINDAIAAGDITVSGGTLDIGSFSDTVGTVTLINGTIAGTTGVLTSAADFAVKAGTISAKLGGAGGLTMTGGGRVTLAGVNEYTGTTTVSWGTLAYGVNDAIADSSDILIDGGQLDIGAFSDTVGTVTLTKGKIAGTTGVLSSTADFDVRAGTVSAKLGGANGLVKTTSATATLTGANEYTGATTITAGVLRADDGTGLPASSPLVINGGQIEISGSFARTTGTTGSAVQWTAAGGFSAFGGALSVSLDSGATLDWADADGLNGKNPTFNNSTASDNVVTLANGLDMNGAARTITVNDNTASADDYAVISGNIINSTGAQDLIKAGAGTLALTGINSYTGKTVISAGALRATGTALSGSLLQFNGGVLESNGTFDRAIGGAGGNVQWNNSGGFAAQGGALAVNLNGGSGTIDWAANTTGLNGKTLILGSTTADNVVTVTNGLDLKGSRTITVNDNSTTTADYAVISGVIADGDATPRNLTKAGAGLLVLSNANTYTGATSITGGTLSVSALANGGSASGIGQSADDAANLLLSKSTTLRYTGAAAATNRLFTLNGGGTNNSTHTIDASGTGAVNFTNTGNMAYGTANKKRVLYLTGSNTGDNTLWAAIDNNGTQAVSITKSGAGTWVLAGTSAYTGATTVNAGTLDVAGSIDSSSVVLNNSGTMITGGGSVKDLTINAGTGFTWAFGDGADHVMDVTTALALKDNWVLKLVDVGTDPKPSQSYDLFTYGSYSGDLAFNDNTLANISIDATKASTWDISALTVTADGGYVSITGIGSSALAGDADENGVVNAADYMALKRHMGTSTSATLAMGNFDTDQDVDFADLQLLIGNYDAVQTGAGTIPEPATLFVLLAAGLPALLKRRQRRS